MTACLDAAMLYHSLGYNPVALCPPDHGGVSWWHRCQSPGKAPLHPWKWQQNEHITSRLLLEYFHLVPAANVGVVLGVTSGLVGVDVDGPEGWEALDAAGVLPACPAFVTGRGLRLLFRLAPGERPPPNGLLAPGVEVLSQGKQTVMPPSLHPRGRVYRWLSDPQARCPPPLPGWLLARPAAALRPPPAAGPITQLRNERLYRMACAARRHGAEPPEVWALLAAVNRRCVPPLEDGELRWITKNACRYAPSA